jgi:hypothetical protein
MQVSFQPPFFSEDLVVLVLIGIVLFGAGAMFGHMVGCRKSEEANKGNILHFDNLDADREFTLVARGGEGGADYAFIRDGFHTRAIQGMPQGMPLGTVFVIRRSSGKRAVYVPGDWKTKDA